MAKSWADRKDQVRKNVQRALDENDMEALADCLPILQKQFAERYIVHWNGKRAVEETDSTTKWPEKMAFIWLNNPGVKAYIKHLTAERTEQYKIDKGYVVQKLIRALERGEEKENDATVLRAAELLARHLGMFVDRTEVSGPDGEEIRIRKTLEDAEDFARTISRLAERSRTDEATQH